MLLDGQSVGYSKTCHSSSSAVPAKTVLEGFTHTALDGTISYTAFKFGSLKPAAGAATVQHVNEIRAGRVDVMVDGVVKVGESVPYPVHDVRWSDYGAAGKQLPEGEQQLHNNLVDGCNHLLVLQSTHTHTHRIQS